jgi:hypothetical protein
MLSSPMPRNWKHPFHVFSVAACCTCHPQKRYFKH